MIDPIPSLGASGMYAALGTVQQLVTFTGPFVNGVAPTNEVRWESGNYAIDFVKEAKRDSNVYVVPSDPLKRYARAIFRIVMKIKDRAYDIILCPLRGARIPGMQCNVMAKDELFFAFDAAYMAKGINDERILQTLREALSSWKKKGEKRKIGVVDTAKGGHSCLHLAKLLSQVNHDLPKENWSVDFHLIHDESRFPEKAREVGKLSSDQFMVNVEPQPIGSLLFEDDDKALGFGVHKTASSSYIYPLQKPGKILYSHESGAALYPEKPLDEGVIELVAWEIARQIQEDPDVLHVDLRSWTDLTK